jgi:integrase/recombinase XerD
MLTIYRRHTTRCPHREEGRRYRRCRCPIWAQGTLAGEHIRSSTGLQNWEKAQQYVREMEATGQREKPTHPEEKVVTVSFACERFLQDATTRGLAESTMRKYSQFTKQMTAFAQARGKDDIRDWNVEITRRFRASWKDSPRSALKKLERLKAFFRFTLDCEWILENPARKLKNPIVRPNPTLPYERDQMVRILAACDRYTDSYGRTGQPNAKKLRALVLLLRYSGLRIGDATSCPVERLQGDRLLLRMHKTGHPVYVKLPKFVINALNSIPRSSESYWFWTGAGTVAGNSDIWRRKLNRLFSLAEIRGGHPHRFRDTFSVELLNTGVPIERVSTLLGHESIRVTERSYNPWVKSRQDRLDADLESAWAQDPLALVLTKGTREVHGKRDTVN